MHRTDPAVTEFMCITNIRDGRVRVAIKAFLISVAFVRCPNATGFQSWFGPTIPSYSPNTPLWRRNVTSYPCTWEACILFHFGIFVLFGFVFIISQALNVDQASDFRF